MPVPHLEGRGLSLGRVPDLTSEDLPAEKTQQNSNCSSKMIMLKITFLTNTKMKFKSETTAVTTNRAVANTINKAFKAKQSH